MVNKSASTLLACGMLAMFGCSSDDAATVTGSGDSSNEATAGTYMISFTNLSTGQPMTPPVVALHDVGTHLFQTGAEASNELREIAENGNNDPMVAFAGSLSSVSASGVALVDPSAPGPIQPGQTASVTLQTNSSAQVLSAVNMIVCSNDGFTGTDSLALPTGTETSSIEVLPYDAGTEVNELNADYWVPPCGGNGANMHEDENGLIGAHAGQTGTGNFDFTGSDPILRIDVVRTGDATGGDNAPSTAGSYLVEFTNLSVGQPMTPPVAAIHDGAVRLYQIGTAASTELQEIAENGNNDPMIALAASLTEVSASGVAFVDPTTPGPMQPGQTATVTLDTAADGHVFSAVNMIVCTNDGFSGVDSIALPSGDEPVVVQAMAYDAGTEVNVLEVDYWVPPCGGSGDNLHDDEDGVTALHPGQSGTGNFDFVSDAPILEVRISRQ